PPRLVGEGGSEGGSLAAMLERLPDVTELPEHIPEIDAEVDGLLLRGAALREMREGGQGLLDARYSLVWGGPRHSLGPSLPPVRDGLVPHLTLEGMLGQPFRLLGETVGIEPFAGCDDAGMQRPPPLA